MVLYGALYDRFGADEVNADLEGALLAYSTSGDSVNSPRALKTLGSLMGTYDFAEKLTNDVRRVDINKRQAEIQRSIDRITFGTHILAMLSPDRLKKTLTGYAMTPNQWTVEGEELLQFVEANRAKYDGIVDRKEYTLAALELNSDGTSKDRLSVAYSVLRQIAKMSGLIVEKTRQRDGNNRLYVPELVGLDSRWRIIQGRAYWQDTLRSLKAGELPQSHTLPDLVTDWCTLQQGLWEQIPEVQQLVTHKNVQVLDLYQAHIREGASPVEARAKALALIAPVYVELPI